MRRFYEIDWLRGCAIVGMVAFHAAFDVDFFTAFPVDVKHGFWLFVARFVQIVFVSTTGMTLAISHYRSGRTRVGARLRHAAFVFGWGMAITAVTWVLFREQAVRFGILHFLGVSMVLALPLLRFGLWNILFGFVVFGLAWIFRDVTVDFSWGFPLGFRNAAFQSLDYFPLFPWFGLFLLGAAAGSAWIKKPWHYLHTGGVLAWLGRHSLIIYLAHQPVLVGVLWMLKPWIGGV